MPVNKGRTRNTNEGWVLLIVGLLGTYTRLVTGKKGLMKKSVPQVIQERPLKKGRK